MMFCLSAESQYCEDDRIIILLSTILSSVESEEGKEKTSQLMRLSGLRRVRISV